MKNKEVMQKALRNLAMVMTNHQDECREFIYVASALWYLSQYKLDNARQDADMARAINNEIMYNLKKGI